MARSDKSVVQENINSMIDVLFESDWSRAKSRTSLAHDLLYIKALSKDKPLDYLTCAIIQETNIKAQTIKRLRTKRDRNRLLKHWKNILPLLERSLREEQ